jgi:DNA-binding MarR family transcriptional regulator
MSPPRDRETRLADLMVAGQELSAAAVFFHACVAEALGLGPADTKALDVLQRQGEMTPKELGQLTGLAPASITGMVDRLEARGLVRRRPHPVDGRRVLVSVIPEALHPVMTPLFTPFITALRERYDDLDDDQLALLAELFHDIARIQMDAAHDLGHRGRRSHDATGP